MQLLQWFRLVEVCRNHLLRRAAGAKENGSHAGREGNHHPVESRSGKGFEERRIRFHSGTGRMDQEGYRREIRSTPSRRAFRHFLARNGAIWVRPLVAEFRSAAKFGN